MKAILEKLKARGARIGHDYEYVDSPEGRVRREQERILFIDVPLTPQEWFSLCTREGGHYIGGCCGQTGYTQDVLNAIFREGGSIDDQMAHELRQSGGGHDGFELLTEDDEKKLLKAEAGWDELQPLDKIFLCVAAIYPHLELRNGMPHKVNLEDPKDFIRTLYKGAAHLDWTDFVKREDPDGQQHANNVLTIARVIPAAQSFLKHAGKLAEFPWNGFAILGEDNKPLSAIHGLALFQNRKAAEDLLAAWKRSKEEPELAEKARIGAVRISIEKELEVID